MTAARAPSASPSAGPGPMDTRIITAAEIKVWLKSAIAGDRLVYCTGPAMLAGPTNDLIAKLRGERRIACHKRRPEGGGALEHFLVKLRPPAARPMPEPSIEADAAAERIFAALERCALRRRRALSDHDLAKIAGLATRNQAAWRLRKLAEAGRIAIETVAAPPGKPWRVVTIAGRSTLRPPGQEGR